MCYYRNRYILPYKRLGVKLWGDLNFQNEAFASRIWSTHLGQKITGDGPHQSHSRSLSSRRSAFTRLCLLLALWRKTSAKTILNRFRLVFRFEPPRTRGWFKSTVDSSKQKRCHLFNLNFQAIQLLACIFLRVLHLFVWFDPIWTYHCYALRQSLSTVYKSSHITRL